MRAVLLRLRNGDKIQVIVLEIRKTSLLVQGINYIKGPEVIRKSEIKRWEDL